MNDEERDDRKDDGRQHGTTGKGKQNCVTNEPGAGCDNEATRVAGFIEEQEKRHSQGGHKADGHRVIVQTAESDFPQIVESAEVPAVQLKGDISLTNNDDPREFPQVSGSPNGRDTNQKRQQYSSPAVQQSTTHEVDCSRGTTEKRSTASIPEAAA